MTNEYPFERFLRAVHLRMVLLRGVERIGLCLLAGCAAAIVLVPILILRGQGTGELVAALLGAAAVAGLAWGVAARPTKLAAAIEADRQLGLSDLLGTALMLRRMGAPDEMDRTVLAMAEARCRQASASAVVLNRLGVRSWGGIGLAAALVIGLSLLGADPNRATAARAAAGPRSWQEIEAQQEKENASRAAANSDFRRAKPGQGGDDDDPLNAAVSHPDPATGTVTSNPASKNGDGGSQEGSGAGAGQSASRGGSSTPANPLSAGSANTTGADSRATSAGGGAGAASEGSAKATGASGGAAGVNQPRKPAPVWRGESWPADQDAAKAAIRNGQIPDAYRDLVREYFERE
ncbi:MAG: hypothetical protein JWN40_2356 [Phycisphaerales bacterium]|nr:hypothetical protein [Phycisphaerales bacterium]